MKFLKTLSTYLFKGLIRMIGNIALYLLEGVLIELCRTSNIKLLRNIYKPRTIINPIGFRCD